MYKKVRKLEVRGDKDAQRAYLRVYILEIPIQKNKHPRE